MNSVQNCDQVPCIRDFPKEKWPRKPTEELGIDKSKLQLAIDWLKGNAGEKRYRLVVIRHGYLAVEWNQGVGPNERLDMFSAAKSLYSSILGVAIKEGKISSVDDKVVDYYPEMMDVYEGTGPKPGRHAKAIDREITFRQLITNMSGYMKPAETPDSRFHYQTFGMNIVTHATAKLYGYYETGDPERLPGFGKLVEERIRDKIGGTWTYSFKNFNHPPRARIGVFGYYTSIESTAYDMARMGYLWLNDGNWGQQQIIPKQWMQEATRTAPNIKANCARDEWNYGYAFWTNDYGKLWPNLPKDSYAAAGAHSQHIWICPSLDLIVVQSPGIWTVEEENDRGILRLLVDACI